MVYQVSDNADFQEHLHVIEDAETGFRGIIAIHSTARGPAAGGCRLWHYDSHADLAVDAVRLARGMSYKNAMAGLPFGGGKAVLQRPAGDFDRLTLFRAFAEAIEVLEGQYITAQDVGSTVADMQVLRERTRYVAGLDAKPGKAGGSPSLWTALGVFESMQATAQFCLRSDLAGLTVAVQGAGSVGRELCRMLAKAKAKLIIADIDDARSAAIAHEFGAEKISPNEVLSAQADIYAPCALGGTLDPVTIPALKAKIVCGAANNQLSSESDGALLFERGIAYAPDYVVNAGGMINVSAEYLGETTEKVKDRVLAIAPRLLGILQESRREAVPANELADRKSRQLIGDGQLRDAA